MLLSKERISEDVNINLSSVKSNKFKASVMTFSMTLPLTPNAVAYELLLSGLMRRGTLNLPSMAELNRSLDELYGSYVEVRSSHTGNNLSLIISTEVLDNEYIPDGTDVLGGVIDIVADIILSPLIKSENFDRQIFEQERKIVDEALASEKNNTRAYSIRKCAELIREGSSLYPPTEELRKIVANATLEDVVAHYNKLILTAPLDIFYIGATEPAVIKEKIITAFKNYPCASECNIQPLRAYKLNKFTAVTEKMSVSQGKLAMGFSTGVHLSREDDRYYTALMLNEIFGGSASSKLFLNVREKMSLCYYCSSTFSVYTGVMLVSSGIEVCNMETVKSAILDQLEQIKCGNISKQELEAARKSISNSYCQLYDSPFDMQSFYSGRAMFGITDSIDDCRKKLLSVSVEDIVSIAKQISLDALFFVEGTNDTQYAEDADDE